MQERQQAIAICGYGAVTPYGAGTEKLWQGVLEGVSAISSMDLFDLGGLSYTRAGVVREVLPSPAVSRALAFALAAGREALDDAGIGEKDPRLEEIALVTASNFGEMDVGEGALIPRDLPSFDRSASARYPAASLASGVARSLGVGGLRLPLSLSCSSGGAALAVGAELIRSGRARRVLVIGVDALSRFAWSGLCSLRTMTREKVRPFDLKRSGTIFSEGAGALLLESPPVSPSRSPHGWLSGWATGNNGHHLTAPAPRGAGSFRVMRDALLCAGLKPGEIDHINAHGTGTRANDRTEAEAILDLFGGAVPTLPVTSAKGALGHTLGAAGTLEAILSLQTLERGVIPPTSNLEEQDPSCPLRVATRPLEGRYSHVLSNSAGFGGCNAAVVLSAAPSPASLPSPARPVVVVGTGCVSALGVDRIEAAAAWREGESACFPLERFTLEGEEAPEVGEVPEIDLAGCGITPKPYLDPASRYLLAACGQALGESGLDAGAVAASGTGIAVGTAWGCAETAGLFFADYMRKGPRLVKPFLFPHTYSNTSVSLAAMELSLKGPHANCVSPRSASGLALVWAVESIRRGAADAMVAAGTDALSPLRLDHRGGEGDPLGEAGAAVVLEQEEHAVSRGAEILARIVGIGLAKGVGQALDQALDEAGIERDAPALWLADRASAEALAGIGIRSGCRLLSPLSGECAGATFLLAMTLAVDGLDRGCAVLVTTDEDASVVTILKSVKEE